MQFEMKRALGALQAADADPVAAPEDIPAKALMRIPFTLRNSDTVPGRLIFSAEGTATQTISVDVWALDDTGNQASSTTLPTQAARAARVFALATAAPIVVTVGELAELPLTDVMPGPGTIYIRVAATAPADASVIKVAAAN